MGLQLELVLQPCLENLGGKSAASPSTETLPWEGAAHPCSWLGGACLMLGCLLAHPKAILHPTRLCRSPGRAFIMSPRACSCLYLLSPAGCPISRAPVPSLQGVLLGSTNGCQPGPSCPSSDRGLDSLCVELDPEAVPSLPQSGILVWPLSHWHGGVPGKPCLLSPEP